MFRLPRLGFFAVALAAFFQFGMTAPKPVFAECDCAACRAPGPFPNLGVGTTPTPRAPEYGQPDLFYNFYVPPAAGGVGTQMYLAPGPVPRHVGHTYYTYQPFMPHELLYKHKRVYHRYYNEGRGLTRTSIRWW